MNINRHLSVPLLAMLLWAPVSAREVTVFLNGSSAGQKFDVALADRFSFSNGQLVVQHGGAQFSLPLSAISKISFGGTATGVGAAAADDDIRAYVADGEIRLVGYNYQSAPLPASLYGMNGTLYIKTGTLRTDAISMASLPKGLYILKLGNRTYKLYK